MINECFVSSFSWPSPKAFIIVSLTVVLIFFDILIFWYFDIYWYFDTITNVTNHFSQRKPGRLSANFKKNSIIIGSTWVMVAHAQAIHWVILKMQASVRFPMKDSRPLIFQTCVSWWSHISWDSQWNKTPISNITPRETGRPTLRVSWFIEIFW